MKLLKIFIFLIFLLSGICGLIYEVVWSKYFALFIGSSGYSHTIVLATYMAGLAIGAYVFGKLADRLKNQLRLYGILEIAIGIYCLVYPLIISFAETVFVNIALSFDLSSQRPLLLLFKFIISAITILPPTIIMGGTLPLLAKFISARLADSDKNVAVLYYINSAGAVIGTALAGFYLLRVIGVEATILSTSLFNILIGLLAFFLSKKKLTSSKVKQEQVNYDNTNNQHYSKAIIQIAMLTALFSGFIAMIFELAWIRMLSNILGSTTYSFSLMLVAFIGGIAIGSFLVSIIIRKIKNLPVFLAVCQLGTFISMILMLPLYERIPYFLFQLSQNISNTPDNFNSFLVYKLLLSLLVMLLPTVFSGMSLPVACKIANKDIHFLGKSIGSIFSINTIGSVAGALLVGLVLIPMFGVKNSLEIGVFLSGLLGLLILSKSCISAKFTIASASVFLFIGLVYKIYFPNWNQNFLISGVFRTLYQQNITSYEQFRNQQNEGHVLLWYSEGIDANVAVRKSVFNDTVQNSLVINGKADASAIADLPTQVLLAQLPLMLYPNTGDALVIGLGSGITCGSALRHPIRSLDVVEISEEVVACNHFFEIENYNFSKDPRSKIFIEDAITKLKISNKKYDHIISEPSNPWIAGIGNLYTVEFFELCKKRLTSNGVLTQWFHTYDADNKVFEIVLSTICKVFPQVSIWKVSDADIIILASEAKLLAQFEAQQQKFEQPKIANELTRIKIFDLPTLLSTQIVSTNNNPYLSSEKPLNTSNNSLLEYLAPVTLYTHSNVTVTDSIDERFTFQDKSLLFSDYLKHTSLSFDNYLNIARYRAYSDLGDVTIAYTALRKATELKPLNAEASTMLSNISARMRLPEFSERNYQLNEMRKSYESNPTDINLIFPYLNALVEFYRIENSIVNPQQMNDAVNLMLRSIELVPAYSEQFQFILGMIYTGAGRYNEAVATLIVLNQYQEKMGIQSQIISKNNLLFAIAECYYNLNNKVQATQYLNALLSIDPQNPKARLLQQKIKRKQNYSSQTRFKTY